MSEIGAADFDLIAALRPIAATLADLHVPYALTGSLAAVAYGVPRAVNDVDIVADLNACTATHVQTALAAHYASDWDTTSLALQARTSFPLIDLATLITVDLLLPGDRDLDRSALGRATPTTIAPDLPSIPILTPEDLILFALERAARIWPRRGFAWYDLQYLLKLRDDLDHDYLDATAGALGWQRGLTTARVCARSEPLSLDLPLAAEQRMLSLTRAQSCEPVAYVAGVRADGRDDMHYQRQLYRERFPLLDEHERALKRLAVRSFSADDPAYGERLADLVRRYAVPEAADGARR